VGSTAGRSRTRHKRTTAVWRLSRSTHSRTALRRLGSAALLLDVEVGADVAGHTRPGHAADAAPPGIEALRLLLLQSGLAFVLVYASLSTLFDPLKFVGYVPSWMAMPGIGMGPMLRCFACFELVLAIAMMTRRFARPAALAAALTLAGVTVTNPSQFDVLFRNVAIVCAALALAVAAPAPAPAQLTPRRR